MYATNAQNRLTLSDELRNVIQERNILTTRSRMKVLSALADLNTRTINDQKNNLRCKAIQEVLTSEVSYLHQLELIMTYFMNPLKEKNYIPTSVHASLFGNIETIYNVNGELLKELRKSPGNIASAFLKMAPFFKLYSVYAFDYKQMLATLQCLMNNNPEFNSFIQNQECRPEVGNKLVSLLITPIQRIPRYRLLLKEVLTNTSTSHPDYVVLRSSLQEVEQSAEHINRLVEDHENMQKMINLQKSLCGGKPKIVVPGRKLIKEGKLMKVSPHGRKAHPRYFLLFSDMLMYCKIVRPSSSEPNSLRCCCILPLKDCRVEDILSKGMFMITCYSETLIMYSESSEEGEQWIKALKDAVKQFQDCRQTLRKDSSSRRPMRRVEILNSFKFDLTNQTNRKRKRLRRELEDVYQCDDHSPGKKCFSGARFKTMKFRPTNPWKRIKLSHRPKPTPPSTQPTQQQQSPPNELKDSLYPLRASVTGISSTLPKKGMYCAWLHCERQSSTGIRPVNSNHGQGASVTGTTNMGFNATDTPLEGETNMAFNIADTPLEGVVNRAFNIGDTPVENQTNIALASGDSSISGQTNMGFDVVDTPLEGVANVAFNPNDSYSNVERKRMNFFSKGDSLDSKKHDQNCKTNTDSSPSKSSSRSWNWHMSNLQKIRGIVSAIGQSIYKHLHRHNATNSS